MLSKWFTKTAAKTWFSLPFPLPFPLPYLINFTIVPPFTTVPSSRSVPIFSQTLSSYSTHLLLAIFRKFPHSIFLFPTLIFSLFPRQIPDFCRLFTPILHSRSWPHFPEFPFFYPPCSSFNICFHCFLFPTLLLFPFTLIPLYIRFLHSVAYFSLLFIHFSHPPLFIYPLRYLSLLPHFPPVLVLMS